MDNQRKFVSLLPNASLELDGIFQKQTRSSWSAVMEDVGDHRLKDALGNVWRMKEGNMQAAESSRIGEPLKIKDLFINQASPAYILILRGQKVYAVEFVDGMWQIESLSDASIIFASRDETSLVRKLMELDVKTNHPD